MKIKLNRSTYELKNIRHIPDLMKNLIVMATQQSSMAINGKF